MARRGGGRRAATVRLSWIAVSIGAGRAPWTRERELHECGVSHRAQDRRERAIGPDLTHVASRRAIAAGMLRNDDTANLEAWITHVQSLEPGVPMPDLTAFTGRELRPPVAYVQQLT